MADSSSVGYSTTSERAYIRCLLLLFAFLELLSFSGLTPPPHSFFNISSITGWLDIIFFVYLGGAMGRLPLLLALLSGGLVIIGVRFGFVLPHLDQKYLVEYGLAGAGVVALLHTLFQSQRGLEVDRKRPRDLLYGFALAILLSLVGPNLLPLTFTLHPMTHDLEIFRLDAAYGVLPAAVLALWTEHHQTVGRILAFAYNNATSPLLVLYGFQIVKPGPVPVKIVDVTILSVLAAFVAYHIYPVTGPIHVFGNNFPGALPLPGDVPLAKSLVYPAERNGMPSIHFGWALAAWLLALREALTVRVFFFVAMVMVALATLTLGEHYLVDLVVAFPFMLVAIAVSQKGLPWQGRRLHAALWGGGLYLFWLLLMWFAIPFLVEWPIFLFLIVVATIGVSVYWFVRLHRAGSAQPVLAHRFSEAARKTTANAGMLWGMFFVSGAAALIYQVLFSKQLTNVFGSMSTATNTVLATYMGGMALGAWLGGILAPRLSRPVVAYSVCEILIALYCAATPAIFVLMRELYVAMAHGNVPDAPGLLALRIVIGATGLLVPTVLMGMTLPVLARFFEQRSESLGISVGRLYTANTLGAALGAILAGYLIIPMIGIRSTTMLAVVANLLVGYLGIRLQKRLGERSSVLPEGRENAKAEVNSSEARTQGLVAVGILLVGGFVTLALEVNDIHLLAVAAGNSTYAFSLMLFSFLVGLGGGAELGRALMRRFPPSHLLVWLELGLCIAILSSALIIDDLPVYFAGFEGYQVVYGFAAREVIRGMACFIAMLPSAVLIGAIFPVAIECVGRGFPRRQIYMLGVASSMNTVGNISGVLLAGFVLLPAIGALHSVQLLAAVCLALGIVAAACTGQLRLLPAWLAVGVAGSAFALQPTRLNYDALTTGANVYFYAQPWGHVIDHAESLDGGLTSVNEVKLPEKGSVLTLLTNGKFQGNNDTAGEMIAQKGVALASLLHTSERNTALVIGYGTGNTSRVLHDAGFRTLDIADISADIYKLANRHFSVINKRVSEEPNVHAYVTDGRNFLLLSDSRYDLISMEISSIWFAGAASLYNSDFYRLARQHLTSHGVLQQWIQLHHIAPLDLLYVIGSMRSEYKYVWFYIIGGQGILVASDDAGATPNEDRIHELSGVVQLNDLYAVKGGSPKEIASDLVLTPEQTDYLLDSQNAHNRLFVSTDDNAHLEYSTPKGNALDTEKSEIAILKLLQEAVHYKK